MTVGVVDQNGASGLDLREQRATEDNQKMFGSMLSQHSGNMPPPPPEASLDGPSSANPGFDGVVSEYIGDLNIERADPFGAEGAEGGHPPHRAEGAEGGHPPRGAEGADSPERLEAADIRADATELRNQADDIENSAEGQEDLDLAQTLRSRATALDQRADAVEERADIADERANIAERGDRLNTGSEDAGPIEGGPHPRPADEPGLEGWADAATVDDFAAELEGVPGLEGLEVSATREASDSEVVFLLETAEGLGASTEDLELIEGYAQAFPVQFVFVDNLIQDFGTEVAAGGDLTVNNTTTILVDSSFKDDDFTLMSSGEDAEVAEAGLDAVEFAFSSVLEVFDLPLTQTPPLAPITVEDMSPVDVRPVIEGEGAEDVDGMETVSAAVDLDADDE